MKNVSSLSGLTVLELVVALSLSAVIISSAYKAQLSFSKAASRENDKAMLQRDLISSCDMIEKDIRMAGLGLPGNGVDLHLSDTVSDELTIFVNKGQLRTTLYSEALYTDMKILVNRPANVPWGRWVCLEAGSIVFKEISRVGLSLSGNPDTIHLAAPLNSGPYPQNSNIYSADRISYFIKNKAEKVLCRRFNNRDLEISMIIDSISIIPKDNSGLSLSSGAEAKVLGVVIGGYIGHGNNRVFLAESTEVNIRNVN
jgi:type II secretory pathway component PulJ